MASPIKNVRELNINLKNVSEDIRSMKEEVVENTKELEQINKEIQLKKAQDNPSKDWHLVANPGVSDLFPLVKDDKPAIDISEIDLTLKKLNVL